MNKEEILIGIFLPIFNPPIELLEKQIESIRDQTYQKFLCVIHIDGGIDVTGKLESIISRDSRFMITYFKENLGIYSRIEMGIRELLLTSCDYICFSDQDDIWESSKLEGQLENILTSGASLLSSDCRIVSQHGILIRNGLRKRRRFGYLSNLYFANEVSGAGIMMARKLAMTSVPFPKIENRKHHDHYLALLAATVGEIFIEDALRYRWVQHGFNQSGDRSNNDWDTISKQLSRLNFNSAIACRAEVENYMKDINEKKKTFDSLKSPHSELEIVRFAKFISHGAMHGDFVIGVIQEIIYRFWKIKRKFRKYFESTILER